MAQAGEGESQRITEEKDMPNLLKDKTAAVKVHGKDASVALPAMLH